MNPTARTPAGLYRQHFPPAPWPGLSLRHRELSVFSYSSPSLLSGQRLCCLREDQAIERGMQRESKVQY